ncbi:MAG: hypothetical protein J3Q66DRAFT_323772 [Benniella sp.]|nr:MAG: hypothetical protein J3Q66DRAFT_323772 [Benniella sp.]
MYICRSWGFLICCSTREVSNLPKSRALASHNNHSAMNPVPSRFGQRSSEEMQRLHTQEAQQPFLQNQQQQPHHQHQHHHSPFPPTQQQQHQQRHEGNRPVDQRSIPTGGTVAFSHPRGAQPTSPFAQSFSLSNFDGSHVSAASSTLNTNSGGYAPPPVLSSGLSVNQTYGYTVGSGNNNNNNNANSNNSSITSSHTANNNSSNSNSNTGLESLESLASLSVLSPTLPLSGGENNAGRRHSATGGHPADNNSSSVSPGGYFSSSFQPAPSVPVINSGHSSGPNSLDLFSGFQGQRKQTLSYPQVHHHHQQPQQQQQSSFRQVSSSYSITPPLPSPVSGHPGPQHYNQQQDSFYRSSQQQQQHYPPTSPSTSFSRDSLPRSRSQSLTVATATAAPVSISLATGATGAITASFTNTPTATSVSADTTGTKKGIVIPVRPRVLPPRPPQLTAPRKYHGRQMRKIPNSSVDHRQISGLEELMSPTRRVAHIVSEQKRREKINAGFEELKSVIPECAQNTDSKASILRKAVDRILELEEELRKFTDVYQQERAEEEDEEDDEE